MQSIIFVSELGCEIKQVSDLGACISYPIQLERLEIASDQTMITFKILTFFHENVSIKEENTNEVFNIGVFMQSDLPMHIALSNLLNYLPNTHQSKIDVTPEFKFDSVKTTQRKITRI